MAKTDQFFKALVREFLAELLTLFFPDVAAKLDLATARFLGTQVYTNWPAGLPRDVDVLAEVSAREDEPAVIAIHVEVQARQQAVFPARMHEYYMALRLRLQKPVFPIALLLTPNSGGLTTGRHVDSVLTREVATLNYAVVGLLDLREEDFASSNDPLAIALRSLMKTHRPRSEVIAECLNRLYESNEAEGRKHMLAVLALDYSPLTEAERSSLKERLREEEPEMHEWMTREEEQRYKTGLREGKREQLLEMVEDRFGRLSEALRSQVLALNDRDSRKLSKRLFEAKDVADLGLPLN